jgi:phosphoesterase RecJ-like protein
MKGIKSMDKQKLHDIYEAILAYDTIILMAHKRPDGDAAGSTFGMKDILKTTWPEKHIHVVGETSDFTSFIGVPEELDDEVFEGALCIALDTGNAARLGDERHALCDKLIKIDHHIPVDEYGDIQYVDTKRPAAALIVLDFFQTFQDTLKMTKEGAKALYFGTLTDTGRFKYDGVDGDTFRSVALLFDNGLDKREVHDHLDQRSEELTRFRGYLLQHYKKTKHGVVYFKIKPRHLRRFNVTLEEASSLVNEMGVFQDHPIWLLFAEYEERIVRCRMRSKGPAINELAAKYDGGGHKFASGANLGTWKRANQLIQDADELARQYKQGLLE